MYLPKACLVWKEEDSRGLTEIKTSDEESESVSSSSSPLLLLLLFFLWLTSGCSSGGGLVELDPEAAEVTSMCHRVATEAIPWALWVILAAPNKHKKNPHNWTVEQTWIFHSIVEYKIY